MARCKSKKVKKRKKQVSEKELMRLKIELDKHVNNMSTPTLNILGGKR